MAKNKINLNLNYMISSLRVITITTSKKEQFSYNDSVQHTVAPEKRNELLMASGEGLPTFFCF